MKDYPIGSILRRRLDGIFGLFLWHTGVYVGDGKVAHFNGVVKKQCSATIRIDAIVDFAGGHTVFLHYLPKDNKHGVAIVERAHKLHRRPDNGFDCAYQMITNNCQDFCSFCYAC